MQPSLFAKICKTNNDCNRNAKYCDVIQRCYKNKCINSRKRCTNSARPICNEQKRRCEAATVTSIVVTPISAVDCTNHPDRDGDGSIDVRCGGDDCDDNDYNRYPGNVEVCDAQDKDEDCNPHTFGRRDGDKDGQIDIACCNTASNGGKYCGRDCDDSNPVIVVGSQTCVTDREELVKICGKQRPLKCGYDLICFKQPNGLGICAP